MFKKLIITAGMLLASSAAHADANLLFAGGSATQDSYYTYLGGVHALNGDLGKEGLLLRASGAWGQFTYDRPSATDVDGDVAAGDLMLGYQKFLAAGDFLQGARFTLYVGGDYQNDDLSPKDPANPVSGSEFGLKGQAEASINLLSKVSLDLSGSYSGAYNSYWSKGQLGYDIGGIKVGPEVAFMGSESYDQQRLGAFVKDIPLGMVKLGASAGYADSARRGKDGAYGEIGISTTF